jgi:hypothetical protein
MGGAPLHLIGDIIHKSQSKCKPEFQKIAIQASDSPRISAFFRLIRTFPRDLCNFFFSKHAFFMKNKGFYASIYQSFPNLAA